MEIKKEWADGLYFDMPEEVYHTLPRLSASGIKDMRISPSIFWAKSWMNKDRERIETEAMKIGSAFHKRILEGAEIFYEKYAPQFDAADVPDALRTNDDLKARLKELGQPVTGVKDVLIERLLSVQPDALILQVEEKKYEDLHAGKMLLAPVWIKRIELAAAFINRHPELSKCFTGGHPEVTVLWTDDGVQMKSRFDYLKSKALVDLKTFGNPSNKPIDGAIYGAMANEKYHIQAAMYYRAIDQAKIFARAMLEEWSKPDAIRTATEVTHAQWLKSFATAEAHEFYFVFQLKHDVPIARGKKFGKGRMWQIGEVIINDAMAAFKKNREIFGDDMWIEQVPIDSFDDDQFPAWATEL